MKPWEVEKINERYAEVDRLTEENTRLRQENLMLKHNANMSRHVDKIDRILELVEGMQPKTTKRVKK